MRVKERENTYLITAKRKECGFRTHLSMSMPHNLVGAQPFKGKKIGVDRLSIGSIRSNFFGTHFYTFPEEDILTCLQENTTVTNNEVRTLGRQ